MQEKITFFESTNRQRLSEDDFARSIELYEFNYHKLLPASLTARMVELGCSEGTFLQWLSSMGYKNFIGLDSDYVAIETAKNRLKGVIDSENIVVEDVLDYVRNCENDSVEMFFMINVIEHLAKICLLDLIPEIFRTLKPGGKFLVQTGNLENPFNLGLFTRDFTHQIPFTVNSLRQLMILSGFSNEFLELGPVKFRTNFHNWPLLIISPAAQWLVKIYALCMRIRIRETAPIIYCIAIKNEK
jgi:SAM-dependent methyltransferase